jgi:uncharacterized protein YqgC (DUF456 family)
MISALLIIIGLLVSVIGLGGCIIPALPGPPLSFLALVILELAIEDAFTLDFYYLWGGITVVVFILDYVLPILGAKAYRASNYGILGSIIGMIVGIIFFPPFGMVGSVTFFASMLMIFIKLAVSGVMLYYFVKRSIEYYF